MVSLKPPSFTYIAGVPTANASIGVNPKGSPWAKLILALAFLSKTVNSFCVNLGANQTSTLHDFACSFS